MWTFLEHMKEASKEENVLLAGGILGESMEKVAFGLGQLRQGKMELNIIGQNAVSMEWKVENYRKKSRAGCYSSKKKNIKSRKVVCNSLFKAWNVKPSIWLIVKWLNQHWRFLSKAVMYSEFYSIKIKFPGYSGWLKSLFDITKGPGNLGEGTFNCSAWLIFKVDSSRLILLVYFLLLSSHPPTTHFLRYIRLPHSFS